MKLLNDLGMVFPTEQSKQKRHYGIFECPICKNGYRAMFRHIKSGASTKCKSCSIKTIKTTHGQTHKRLYNIWKDMRRRCSDNPKRKTYKNYFLRGIRVCDEWNHFENFHHWSLENGYTSVLSIDRKDNEKNYSPSNCRWVNKNIQSRNTRLLMITNTSGYRGVSASKSKKKFVAQITVDKKVIYLGQYEDKLSAAKAYDSYVIENSLEHTLNGVL